MATGKALLWVASVPGHSREPIAAISLAGGNFNRCASEAGGGEGRVKGIVFDRTRPHNSVRDEFDGQWAIASVESPGVEISYQTTFVPENAKDVWEPFSKDGRLSNND